MDMYRVRVRVKELCQERDWSLNELSLRSGVTYSTVRRYAMQPLGKVTWMRYAESRKYWVAPGTNYLKYKGIARSMSKSDDKCESLGK